MNRGTGAGLMAFSVVLVVVGAIMEFAVTVTTTGFSIHTVGIILLAVGIALFVVSLVILAMGTGRRTTIHEDVHHTPGGSERIYDERDNLSA
jgi:uncharacterized membrane protein YgdD (TMEM256/DUF423 family)